MFRKKNTATLKPCLFTCFYYLYTAEPKSFPLALVLGCVGAVLLVLLLVVLLYVRHRRAGRSQVVRKIRVAPYVATSELEMEVRQTENDLTQEDSTVAIIFFFFDTQ